MEIGIICLMHPFYPILIPLPKHTIWDYLPSAHCYSLKQHFLLFFSWGHPQQKVKKSQEFPGMDCLIFFIKGQKSQGLKINSCKSFSYYIWFIRFNFSQILRLTKAGSNLYPRNVFYSCRSQTPDMYPNDGPYLRIPLI